MTRYRALAVSTKYWMPGEDYIGQIILGVKDRIVDGDVVVVSEKAISIASKRIIDESLVRPSLTSRLIARFWMRVAWGYFLGTLCHLRRRLVLRLRRYPSELGSSHKQLAIVQAGLLQGLMFGSEGGIDGSNLPHSYVSMPLVDAESRAEEIRLQIVSQIGKEVVVIISDTDKTYSLGGFHFTPRPRPVRGIHSIGGFAAYVAGRMFRLKRRATPIAVAGGRIPVETALELSEVANRARGFGAGRTVWDMAERFDTGLTGVTWEMLKTVKHKPVVIVRSRR